MTYQDSVATLKKGDTLVLYTDGVIEAQCVGSRYGDDRFLNSVANLRASASEMPEILFTDLMDCTGGKLSDDLALLCITLKGGKSV